MWDISLNQKYSFLFLLISILNFKSLQFVFIEFYCDFIPFFLSFFYFFLYSEKKYFIRFWSIRNFFSKRGTVNNSKIFLISIIDGKKKFFKQQFFLKKNLKIF